MNDKHKIQIGDVLYQPSKSYNKVFAWTVVEIWVENYLTGPKTIVKCSNGIWTEEFFLSDVVRFSRSREFAERHLAGVS